MKITIRPDPDCIDLMRQKKFKENITGFLKSVGVPKRDAENWEATHTIEIDEKSEAFAYIFNMKCFLPDELFSKPEWVFKFSEEKFFTLFVISGSTVCCCLLNTEGLKNLPKNLLNLLSGYYDCETLNECWQELLNCQSLKSISFSNCKKLKDISLLGNLINLQILNLCNCESLTDISFLSWLVNLQTLNLGYCNSLEDISSLSGLINLRSLDLDWCKSLKNLSSLSGLINLRSLDLSVCDSLTEISSIAGLLNLRSLDLACCKLLTDIRGLSKLINLRSLNFESCKSLTDISSLSWLLKLQSINLSDCKSLTDISSLAGLLKLQTLDLSGCESLTDISSLAGLLNLQTLNLSGCESLTDIIGLAGLPNLQNLQLGFCQSLADIRGLSGLVNLKTLNLDGCKRVKSYLPLRNCLALKDLEESNLHPGEFAELLCFLAVQRKDRSFISKEASSWLQELEMGFDQKHSSTNDLACSLAQALILANLEEIGLSFHQTLLNQPRFGLTPWKIWLNENLKTFGWDKIQKLAELNKPNELTFGAIGGISFCLPSLEGDPAQIAWAKKLISEIHSLCNTNPSFLKPAAAEWCLALKRLGEDELLREWIEKFTDPSDQSALDPINKVFSAYALDLNDSESAFEYALKINDPTLRDESILNLAKKFIKEGETSKAGEFLFLLTQIESRTQLAYSLAEEAAYLKSDENAHRLLTACGDNPQSLASILDKLRLANPASEILKIMHEKLDDEKDLKISGNQKMQFINLIGNSILNINDSDRFAKIQKRIVSELNSN